MPNEEILSCPACWEWQLHYDGPALVLDGTFRSKHELDAVVETLLREHVARECKSPQLIQILLRQRAARN